MDFNIYHFRKAHRMIDPNDIADFRLMVMNYEDTFRYEEWKVSRELAEEMMRTIPGLQEEFRLDQITLGDGDCFYTAAIQQLRRPEVNERLSPINRTLCKSADPRSFKSMVRRFIIGSKHPVVETLKADFENFHVGMSWEHYWSTKHIMKANIWADEMFLRATAWFLKLDIVVHQNIPTCPIKVISGNIDDDQASTSGPKLHVAYLLNRHYQSILPRNTEPDVPAYSLPEEVSVVVPVMQSSFKEQDHEVTPAVCPACGKSGKNILNHIRMSRKCKEKVTDHQIQKLKEISSLKASQKEKEWKKRKYEEDHEKVKENNKKWKAEQRERNPVKSKEDNKKFKADQRARNPEKSMEETRRFVAIHRKNNPIETESQRLKLFLENTLFGAIFICISCHQRHFRTNIQVFNETLRNSIADKIPLSQCIEDMEPLKTSNFGEIFSHYIKKQDTEQFICLTCLGYLRQGKLPPSSVKNGLSLDQTDKQRQKDGLMLTDLENSLIASRIIFQKIFSLPVSRWSAMKEKQVNIPISSDKINETLEKLPRTPTDAGLIVVELKRQIKKKNNHWHQLINPQKLFLFIDKAKWMGNPYYNDVQTFDSYKQSCKKSDGQNFDLVFGKEECDGKDGEELEPEQQGKKGTDDNLEDEILLEEYEKEDPVKKFQFQYDDSVVMTDKFPEISVAPGEDEKPQSMLFDKSWDVRAFPALHNFDGSNGKDEEREVKITDQRYFIQRVTNINSRFAKCPTYLYAVVGYLEEMKINRNINMVGTRGHRTTSVDGRSKYDLYDPYRALEAVPGTPKYWQTAKYEMLAKVDNFGAFNIFYTLSCADLRWSPNFAAILLEKGYHICYDVQLIDGKWQQYIKGRDDHGPWKKLEDFLKEDVDDTNHELIRGNVLTSTRYFDHRVKCFLRDIVLHKSNPMSVKFFTYKVEFQARGAGHIHGTLWLHLNKLESLMKIDGRLVQPEKYDSSTARPLRGISKAFKSLRNGKKLCNEDINVLKSFIDEFTTVTTHPETIGKDVSTIAREVNQHHHTHTCRKYGDGCRFGFPKFPSPETLIAEPVIGGNEEKLSNLKKCGETLKKVKEVLMDSEKIQKIMKNFSKDLETSQEYKQQRLKRIQQLLKIAKVTMEDYMKALKTTKSGYGVVLARDVDETMINNFNAEWLRAWNGNIDIQICLDFHAVVTYITDYYSKSETELVRLIKKSLDESNVTDNQERMKIVSNVFQRSRQMGEAEAVYKLIPSMQLTNSNVSCQWVSIGTAEERSSRYLKAKKQQIEAGIPLVELEGHEGLWYHQQDIWSKYLRRPDELKSICFAQFAKMYRGSKKKYDEDQDDIDDFNDLVDEENTDEMEGQKFHYIMTFDNKRTKRVKLKDIILLKNPVPGETSVMQKRSSPVALRFHKIKQNTDSERYMFGEVMLYYPLQKELEMEKARVLYEDTFDGRRKVDIVKEQVMEYLEGVQEARYHIEMIENDLDFTEVAKLLDPQGMKDNEECEDMDEEESEFEHLNPDDLLSKNDRPVSSGIYKKIEIPGDQELRKHSRDLDEFQVEVLNIVIKYAKDIVKARKQYNKHPVPPYLMMSGGAGAGKSTVIKLVAQWTQKILQQEGQDVDSPCVVTTAFCGTAASNVDGQTLHSSFGFNFGKEHRSLNDKSRDVRRALLKYLKLVIIDEVSMVDSILLYKLDLRLQEITQKSVPFGGIAVLAFGDLMQLPPIMGRNVFEEPNSDEFLITHKINPRWRMFQSILLEKNHRQGRDKSYAELLNRLRVNKYTDDDLKKLRSRVRPSSHADIKDVGLFITALRKAADSINEKYIANLKGSTLKLHAVHHHPVNSDYKPYINKKDNTIGETGFRDEIILKPGARIIMIHNLDVVDSLTNGQLGTFVDAVKNKDGKVLKLILKLDKPSAGKFNRELNPALAKRYPDHVFVERVSWQYSLRKKSGDETSKATLIQFPIRLAFGITAHKVQGSSIPYPTKVAVDVDSAFSAGQTYVMLSRVQCLEQIFIVGRFQESKIKVSFKAIEELQRLEDTSLNRNPRPWIKLQENVLKIASLNCAGLKSHIEDIRADRKLLMADIILLQETSLDDAGSDDFEITTHPFVHHVRQGNGKGVSIYAKKKFEKIACVGEGFQILKIRFDENIHIFNVYRSSNGCKDRICDIFSELIETTGRTVVCGDFNVCGLRERTNKITTYFESCGFRQLVNESTQIKGRQIDHIFLKEMTQLKDLERCSVYYSDHDALLLSLQL